MRETVYASIQQSWLSTSSVAISEALPVAWVFRHYSDKKSAVLLWQGDSARKQFALR
jgi:hypothetical protein